MKVKIKKYPNFYGSGTLIHKLPISEEWQGRIQEWVPEWYDVLANKLVEWQGGRRTTIHIDHYDTWGMDDTLSHIILPMLKQLNATKQGAPIVDNKDVPKELRSEPVKHDICPTHFDKWDWVLDEMIFAFESKHNNWEEQFQEGLIDRVFKDLENGYTEWLEGPNNTFKIDMKGRKAYQKRISNGFRLFGKYYEIVIIFEIMLIIFCAFKMTTSNQN